MGKSNKQKAAEAAAATAGQGPSPQSGPAPQPPSEQSKPEPAQRQVQQSEVGRIARATRPGFFGGSMIQVGQTFTIDREGAFTSSWMVWAEDDAVDQLAEKRANARPRPKLEPKDTDGHGVLDQDFDK